MSERLQVEAPGALLDVLAEHLAGWHKNTLRQRLKRGCVLVNGKAVTRGDHALNAGDEVVVGDSSEAAPPRRTAAGVEILHVDEQLVAIDKPAGLLSVSTDRQRERTALALVKVALSTPGHSERLWPVHRLDRETSGVLLLARSKQACDIVQVNWQEARKTYLAVVEGAPQQASGVIDAPLWEDASLAVHVGRAPGAKDARTRYRTLERIGARALLEVELETGRRHQIRAHLAHLGNPVVGDPRYGQPGPRMGLHALRLSLEHPAHGRRIEFEAPMPIAFRRLLQG